ncbi:MAG: prolipoprotein diacylglyceryl transferase [Lachnospiraceae bacterium]|nr:prolipoprotein diacylglyceryl transferase [Lachnospiraceae bacterium]
MAVDLFSIGPFTIHGYGLMIAIGMISALFIADARAQKKGLNGDYVWQLSILIMFIGWAGGKLMYCIVEWERLLSDPASVLSSSGFVVYGGIITGVLTAVVYCRIRKLDFRDYADLIVPEVSLAQAFGRIGCFLAGCCYGRETDCWCGVVFSHSPYAPQGVKVIPTQLISAGGNFIFFLVLLYFSAKTKVKGHVIALYLMLYSIGRFAVEFLRGDPRGNVGILSTSQFIAIFIFAAGLALWVLFSRIGKGEQGKVAGEIRGETSEAAIKETSEAATEETTEDIIEETTEEIREETAEAATEEMAEEKRG